MDGKNVQDAMVDLLRTSIAGENLFKTLYSEWEENLFVAGDTGSKLTQHIEALRRTDERALPEALGACPTLMANLRSGATDELDSELIRAIDTQITRSRSANHRLEAQSTLMHTFYPS